jgi:sphinganine-1-phosphate aldolase
MHGAHFIKTDWEGGIYATATTAGSRCGASSVGAWASMALLGKEGY